MSSAADFDVKERVRQATDIAEVIGRDLEVRPAGRNLVARCPFHNDTRPSMTINPARQSWKCWVCDIGGDVFSFVMRREGVDFPTALRQLADAAGIELPSRGGPKTEPGAADDRDTLRRAIESVTQLHQRCLQADNADAAAARAYLVQRQISEEAIEKFAIGFAPNAWSTATDHLRQLGFSPEVAVACGAASARSSGEGIKDVFRGRVMFPIRDVAGRVISTGGRVLPALIDPNDNFKPGKYINGAETLLYRKSDQLYGLDLARDAIRRGGRALVMEGYTDVVAAVMTGLNESVAVLGTALTANHVRLLRRYTDQIVLVLDGDEAGRRRADEVLTLFVSADIDLRILTLPGGADPADYLQSHGRSGLEQLARSAPDALSHKFATLTDGIDPHRDTHAVGKAVDAMLTVLAAVPVAGGGEIRVQQMIGRLHQHFDLPRETIASRLRSIRETVRSRERRVSPAAAAVVPSPPRLPVAAPSAAVAKRPAATYPPLRGMERELFEALLMSPELAARAVETIDATLLTSPTSQALFSALQDLEMDGRDLDAGTLLTLVENESLKSLLVSLDQTVERLRSHELVDPVARYNDVLARMHESEYLTQRDAAIAGLRQPLDPDEEMRRLLELVEAERVRRGTG